MGSSILKSIEAAGPNTTTEERAKAVKTIVSELCTELRKDANAKNQATALGRIPDSPSKLATSHQKTRFGWFGGQFIPKT